MATSPTKPKSLNVCIEDISQDTFEKFQNKKLIAVDTEAMGLIHGRDRICLVQICDNEDNVVCIKIKQGQKSAPRLQILMENPNIEKIFHFARFDVAALYSNLNIKVNPLFCTKVASKIGRTYSPRHGLKEVILELVNVELDKQAQSSDWGNIQNLSEKQLSYAANDVRYLIQARTKLKEMLEREGRLNLAEKCFKCIPIMSELDIYRFVNIFEH